MVLENNFQINLVRVISPDDTSVRLSFIDWSSQLSQIGNLFKFMVLVPFSVSMSVKTSVSLNILLYVRMILWFQSF